MENRVLSVSELRERRAAARVQVQDDTDEVTDPLIELLEQWAADDSADEEWPALERILFENGWITEETDDGD
jgi:hypothetical protein